MSNPLLTPPGNPIFVLDEHTYLVGFWFLPAPEHIGGDAMMVLSRRPSTDPMRLVLRTRIYSPGSFAPDGSLAKDPFADGDRKKVQEVMLPADEPEETAIANLDSVMANMIRAGMGVGHLLWRRTPRKMVDDEFRRDLMAAPWCHWKRADRE